MAIRKNQIRQDSATEQLPAKLSAEEEELLALAQKNTKFTREELIIPRLKVLQAQSPEVLEDSNQYVMGAKAGMFYNTSSGKLTPGQEGIIAVIIGHQHQVFEWLPQDQGRGLVKIWGVDDGWKAKCLPEQREALVPITTDGHTIDKQRSFLIFDVTVDTGEYDPSYFNLKSTGHRVASQISTMISNARYKLSDGRIINPPYYYYLYKLTLDKQSNPKGSWWAPRISKYADKNGAQIPLKSITNGEQIFQQAKLMQEHFLEGSLQHAANEWESNTDDLDGDKVTF